MTTRLGRSGRLHDDVAQYREQRRDAELADRITGKPETGPAGPRTRADEKRRAAFARQRAAATPDTAAEPLVAAGEGQGRDSTVVQISATRRTRVRRGASTNHRIGAQEPP